MASWWDRDPAALAAEIEELTDAGFRVHREVAAGARLALAVERESETYRVVYFYAETPAGYRVTAAKPWPRPELAVAGKGTAASAIARLRRGEGRRVFDGGAGCVYVPAAFGSEITGAGGVMLLGRSRVMAGSYALRSLGGSRAELEQPNREFLNAFPEVVPGLWARGEVMGLEHLSAEQVVLAAEQVIALAHGLNAKDLRESRRDEVLGLVRSSRGAAGAAEWLFVRRDATGAPLILTTERWNALGQDARAPFSSRLGSKRVTIIGCGAVGWTLALELARSGVSRFVLYDDDLIRPYNLARLDTYLGAAGRSKVDVLAEQLRSIAPSVQVESRTLEIGTHAGAAGLVADRPDLLINVTGEEISTDETNAASLILQRPAIFAWVSNGVHAGRIIRVRPGESPCYDCVREAAPDPIRTSGPAPVGAENPWTGASFDIDTFACAVARMAVLTLVGEPISARNPDHFVLNFEGVVPTARRVEIPRDPRCAWCA
jgi:molybdopterin/thiamine biosynthesis adenylyltransferase